MASDGLLAANLASSELDRELAPPLMGEAGAGGRCPNATLWKSSCKSRGCPVCGPRWARNQQTALGIGLEWAGVKVATIAITAPGADVLPWDEDHCAPRHRGRAHKHSGARGCRCEARPLREWCETLPWRWKKLREAARLATKRQLDEEGRGDVVPWVLCRVWEPQKRGAPHNHLVVPFGTPAERRAAEAFRAHLERLAPEYGFGRLQKTLKAIEGREAARYLANYLAGRTGKKSSIRQNIADPRLPKSLVWLTPVVTSVSESPRMVAMRDARGVGLGSGVTMRTLRRARHLWAVFAGLFEDHPCWANLEEAVIAVIAFRRVYPKRAGPPGDEAAALAWARAIDRANGVDHTPDEEGRRPRRFGRYLRAIYDDDRHEYVPNQPFYRDLTAQAFLATRSAEAAVAA